MELNKESLRTWLDTHQAISTRVLCREAGLHPDSIRQLYNTMNRSLTITMANKLLPVLEKYGWK